MLCLASVLPMLLTIPEKFENLNLRMQSRDFVFLFFSFGNNNLENVGSLMLPNAPHHRSELSCRPSNSQDICADNGSIPREYDVGRRISNPERTKQSSSRLHRCSNSESPQLRMHDAFSKTLLTPVWSISQMLPAITLREFCKRPQRSSLRILVAWISIVFWRLPPMNVNPNL